MLKGSDPVIRSAREDEAGEITTLVNEAYAIEAFFKVDTDRTTRAEVADLFAQGTFLVADGPDGRLLGSVHVSVTESGGYFGMLSVAPATQRSGLGRRLIAAAEELAVERGCSVMDLSVVNVRDSLLAWYEKAGYRASGTAAWPEGEMDTLKMPVHLITMTKAITPTRAAIDSRR